MPTSGTSCTHVPSGLPGVRPSAENCPVSQATVFSSPSVPGARPSNSSAASVSTAASSVSAPIPAAISGVWPDAPPPDTTTASSPVSATPRCIPDTVNLPLRPAQTGAARLPAREKPFYSRPTCQSRKLTVSTSSSICRLTGWPPECPACVW